eukprot:1921270-Pleurochrysis_carterae.AAC.3
MICNLHLAEDHGELQQKQASAPCCVPIATASASGPHAPGAALATSLNMYMQDKLTRRCWRSLQFKRATSNWDYNHSVICPFLFINYLFQTIAVYDMEICFNVNDQANAGAWASLRLHSSDNSLRAVSPPPTHQL